MIVASKFPGDDNESLMWMQHEAYRQVLRGWSAIARQLVSDAVEVVGPTEFAAAFLGVRGYDHRVVQDMHDLFAAAFRYSLLVVQFDELDARLEKEEAPLQAWREFAQDEFLETARVEPAFVRAYLEAIVHQNTDRGYAAEARLAEHVRSRFREVFSVVD